MIHFYCHTIGTGSVIKQAFIVIGYPIIPTNELFFISTFINAFSLFLKPKMYLKTIHTDMISNRIIKSFT